MKNHKMTIEEIRKEHMEVGERVTDTQNKYKKAKENERIAANLKETIENTDLPEDYRNSLRSKFAEASVQFTDAKNELKEELNTLQKRTNELQEIANETAKDISGAKEDISKVGTKDDDRNIILKLRQKLVETSNGEFNEWQHQEQDFARMNKEVEQMKDNL